MKRILVVGGVAGGASFSARMRRLDETASIVMFERGSHISFANCGLPYHIGETIRDRDNLIIQTPERFKSRFNVDVQIESEVVAVDVAAKSISVRSAQNMRNESYDYLVLAPGAEPLRPPIPGINSPRCMTLRSLPDMDRIKSRVDQGNVRRAVVVGGGFIGLEMAENLRHRDIDVSLIELSDQVFAPADIEMAHILHQHLMLNSVRLLLNDGAKSFRDCSDGTVDIKLNSGTSINADLVVLAIGVKPDTAFLKNSGIELTERGAIKVNKHLQTSVPDVYAVGDAIEVTDFVSGRQVHVPLAGPANRQGRIVADTIAGISSEYKHTQGTAICKIFDLAAAVTGLNEKNAKRYGIEYRKSYTHSASHAGYYPGSYPLSIKLLFAPDSGRVLGAQVIGKTGVDKRIDIFATAIRHKLTISDLSELELSYAPPFGSAKDAVNMAGFVAMNIKDGSMPVWYADELNTHLSSGATLLDVRTQSEAEMGAIDGSLLIPIDELRDRIGEIDKNKPVLVYCQVGLRGYYATRILLQQGYRASNLSGGYKTFSTGERLASEVEYLQPLQEAVCSSPTAETQEKHNIVDARGLQCPGPIIKVKEAILGMQLGEAIEIQATDQGFAADIPAWCSRTGNSLVSLGVDSGVYRAVVRKGPAHDVCTVMSTRTDQKTIVIFSNDLDKMMAAFIIANGAASMGSSVTLFFTFWGLNLLRRSSGNSRVKKNLIEKMLGVMMPRGAGKVKLSKMNMGGMGTLMMQKVMQHKNVYSLPQLIDEAKKSGIRFVACSMSMDIMGIKKEELIDGVEIGGVASYLERADASAFNLFI